MECKKELNSKRCSCSYPCPLHGICCDCIASHRAKKQLPACFFPSDVERTYDRSIENFIKTVQERGTGYLK